MEDHSSMPILKKTILFFRIYILTVLIFGIVFQSNAQTSLENIPETELLKIVFAGYMESVDSPGIQLRKLVNNVQMLQGEMQLFCDSAYFYTSENRVKAMGNVIIEQGDSVQISCQKMNYNGNTEQAILIGKAILNDGNTQISSSQLNYNIQSKYGYYTSGGEIIRDSTTLTSKEAHYYGNTNDVIYKDSVLLIHPEYQLKTDSLNHNLDTEIALYFGPSEVITQTNTIMGDGGYFDMKNNIAHFGNRTKIYGDQYIEADSLYYNGAEKLSRAYGNAIIQQDSLYVEADTVFYNQSTNEGEAYGNAYVNNKGAEIMGNSLLFNDETGKGKAYGSAYYYDEKTEIEGDTILFNRTSGEAEVKGRAYIINEGTQLGGDHVAFNEQSGEGEIIGDALTIDEKGAVIKADTLQFNQEKGRGNAFGNVVYKDTAQHIMLSGNYLEYREEDDFILATQNPFLIYELDKDSLFIKADTLLSQMTTEQADSSRSFSAFSNVRVFKTDMQSVCDSLFYDGIDSTFHFHKKPVVWVNDSQLSGDTIQLHTTNNELDSVKLINNAYIGTITFPNLYDQVKGNYLVGLFKEGNIQDMHVYNDAESIYFIKNDDEAFTAVNQAACDTMQIVFDEEQQVGQIKFISEAKATLNPIDKVQPFQLGLPGFSWLKGIRPAFSNFEADLKLF